MFNLKLMTEDEVFKYCHERHSDISAIVFVKDESENVFHNGQPWMDKTNNVMAIIETSVDYEHDDDETYQLSDDDRTCLKNFYTHQNLRFNNQHMLFIIAYESTYPARESARNIAKAFIEFAELPTVLEDPYEPQPEPYVNRHDAEEIRILNDHIHGYPIPNRRQAGG